MHTAPINPIPTARDLASRLRSPLDRPVVASDGRPQPVLVDPRRQVVSPDDARLAAVLILLFDRGGETRFLLTKRTDHLEHHPGQISLPGGSLEPEDASLAVTALRETREEVGVPEDTVTLVGRLDDVFTHVSGFMVTPFIGVADGPVLVAPDMLEIAHVFDPTVADLLAADARLPERPTIATLRYPLNGQDVWGATARILWSFAARVREVLED